MKIKLSEEQYKKLMSEIGGYDDPMIGRQDEEAIMGTIIEAYKNLTNGMNILSDLIPGILVQDRLRNELMEVRESLVNPLNNFSELLRRIHGQHGQGHMEDSDMELDEGRKKKRKSKKKKSKKSKSKKDACYYKVKSRYKVWPSAYASGALVKCRKVGAKNWGNSTNESEINEKWSQKYKDSIDCNNPKGFSQKAHCDGKKKAS
jgi:F0F1-type ATP synthase assembly protein I